jgi:limonene-1,2-epoxide hydrolase
MTPETQQSESPYSVKIETATGRSTTVPIAVLSPKQLEDFLQIEFKRLAQEAGVKGARVHVERTEPLIMRRSSVRLRRASVQPRQAWHDWGTEYPKIRFANC